MSASFSRSCSPSPARDPSPWPWLGNRGGYDNREPRRQQAALGGWGRRALAAHQNGFEAFPAFAAAVIIAHLAGADPIWSTRLAFVFLASRAVYIPLYLSDLAIVRSLVWTLGFLATVALFLLPFAG